MVGDEPGGPIRWRIHLAVPPEHVFEALDSNGGRASFWAESADESDGWIDFHFIGSVRFRAEVLERVPPRLFALTYFDGVARFELSDNGAGGTDLLLTHEGVPLDDWAEVHAGWLNVLLPLKAHVGFGVDLRNHDPRRTWQDGYADQ